MRIFSDSRLESRVRRGKVQGRVEMPCLRRGPVVYTVFALCSFGSRAETQCRSTIHWPPTPPTPHRITAISIVRREIKYDTVYCIAFTVHLHLCRYSRDRRGLGTDLVGERAGGDSSQMLGLDITPSNSKDFTPIPHLFCMHFLQNVQKALLSNTAIMKIDPAVVALLKLDPEQTTVSGAGGKYIHITH